MEDDHDKRRCMNSKVHEHSRHDYSDVQCIALIAMESSKYSEGIRLRRRIIRSLASRGGLCTLSS